MTVWVVSSGLDHYGGTVVKIVGDRQEAEEFYLKLVESEVGPWKLDRVEREDGVTK